MSPEVIHPTVNFKLAAQCDLVVVVNMCWYISFACVHAYKLCRIMLTCECS